MQARHCLAFFVARKTFALLAQPISDFWCLQWCSCKFGTFCARTPSECGAVLAGNTKRARPKGRGTVRQHASCTLRLIGPRGANC